MAVRPDSAVVFTACHATGADPVKARALLEDLAASYPRIDAAARLLEAPDSRCVYVIVWGWGDDSLMRLRACLDELDPTWSQLVYLVGDPALRTGVQGDVSELREYLRRYWFRFPGSGSDLPAAARLGYGVTATDQADAEQLLREAIFEGRQLPEGAELTADVDVRDLDPGHVVPNMGDPSVRGVWFPTL